MWHTYLERLKNHIDDVTNRVFRPPSIAVIHAVTNIGAYNEGDIFVVDLLPERDDMVVGQQACSASDQLTQDPKVPFPFFAHYSDPNDSNETVRGSPTMRKLVLVETYVNSAP